MRRLLASHEPLDLIAHVSGMMDLLDPRRRDPFERSQDAVELPTLANLVRSFVDIEAVETSALLAVIGELSSDPDIEDLAQSELARRAHRLPTWLANMGQVEAYGTGEVVHILGDGDNVLVGARWPTGVSLTLVVYIDHNLGTLVKDAFVVSEPPKRLLEIMRRSFDAETSWKELEPASARARITDAIEHAAMTVPAFESESWPACRPVVEWIVRQLPEGGTGYERPDWPEAAVLALAVRFFTSPLGHSLDDPDRRSLLESILWFGTDYGPGDPMRWSPTAVEILMLDWIPRKIVADVEFLSKVPKLLSAFVRFCHAERGVPKSVTGRTIAALDEFTAEYREITSSPRPQGPMAILAAIGAIDPDGPWEMPGLTFRELPDVSELMLDSLLAAVGGEQALDALDEHPLPDEAFDVNALPADIRGRVAEILALSDQCCDGMFDVEVRTACRRFLARVATGNPEVFRRQARPEVTAAAVCWIVGKANLLFSQSGGGVYVKDLMAHFGLKGSVSQRAQNLLDAAGVEGSYFNEMRLGSRDFLVSRRRREIIERREHLRAAE